MRIPQWFIEHARKENILCEKCRADFDTTSIIFFGIKNVNFNKSSPTRDMLYCEYICPKCKQKVGYTFFDMTLEQFAAALLDDAQKNPQPASEQPTEKEEPTEDNVKSSMKQRSKSKISPAEAKAAMKMLDNSPNWTDWLGQIGAPTEDAPEKPKPPHFRLQNEDGENE